MLDYVDDGQWLIDDDTATEGNLSYPLGPKAHLQSIAEQELSIINYHL